ncbi:hypothetical protein FNL55_15820 [Tardiphaga sp. vice352]|uniref:hypothetical protein n=1 Tax=Tardiphaga sp. vice352 TaxID=2592816 RepID=UPI00116210EC|nr:hypothetical protein [Tardiphaga sp. vice352]QDM32653.1 hypothetical protein FNL55_15820 [Tardiphaga sp. vice352]
MSDTFQNFAPDDPFGAISEQARGRIVPQAAREWFIASGVPPINLVKTWAGYSDLVLHDDVIFLDNGCFEFGRYRQGKAQQALTFVAWSLDGYADDVIAWQATTDRIAPWLGHACMLGEDNLTGPCLEGGLVVHSTPLEWFRDKRAGVVVLDPVRSAPLLRDAGTLLAGSLDAAKKLKKLLAVELPNILVPQEASA